MRVYLCGPMRGYPAWNAAAFDRYAAEWEEEGHTVLSPVARDRLGGLDLLAASKEELAAKAGDWVWMRQVITEDVEMICQVDIAGGSTWLGGFDGSNCGGCPGALPRTAGILGCQQGADLSNSCPLEPFAARLRGIQVTYAGRWVVDTSRYLPTSMS
jgi:hypothetical protein